MGSIFGTGELALEVANVLAPARTSTIAVQEQPNIGAKTRALLADAVPTAHPHIADNGTIVMVSNGEIIDMHDESSRVALDEEAKKGMPIVVFGVGAGHLIFQARSSSCAAILVYEPDPGIAKSFLAMRYPMQGVTLCCDLDEFRQMFAYMLQGRKGVTVFRSTGYAEKKKVEFDIFSDMIRRTLDAEGVTMNTITFRMREWLMNALANIKTSIGSAPLMRLTGAFEGVPAFIVGAGPSLDKNGHLLQDCCKKGLVITVDVAAKAFVKHNAIPHIFVAVEGKDLSAHLDGVEWMAHVPRAFSLEANPNLFRLGTGTLLPWLDSNFPFAGLNQDVLGVEGLPIGGSCTTAAMLMAEAFGCSKIILVGQDLANTGGKRAAEGVLADKLADLEPFNTVKAWGSGDMIPDTAQWLHARSWFEHRALRCKQHSHWVDLINATDGGSHIDGFAEITLAQVLSTLPDVEIDVSKKLGQLRPIFGESVDWYLMTEREKLVDIAKLAGKMQTETCTIANLLREPERDNAEANALLASRAETESAYRKLAAKHHLFTGWTQGEVIELNELRQELANKQLEIDKSVVSLDNEADIFGRMSTGAVALMAELDKLIAQDV